MQIFRYIGFLSIVIYCVFDSFAQCPQPSFTVPDTICIGESLAITNTSSGADRYEWDFCSGDLEEQPALKTVTTLASALTPTDITTISDGANWYGFVSSRDNNKIFRLDFGNSLSNTPSFTDLGNPGNLLSKPEQMKVVKVGADWIAMIVNLNNYTDDFSVVQINFGNSLTNIPTATRITALDSYIANPRGIDIVNDNGNFIVFIANTLNNVVTIANFGNSLLNTLSSGDIKNVILPGAITGLNVMGISIIKNCDQWYGLAASFNNRIYKLSFGSALFSIPSITEITTTQSLMLSPVKVAFKQEGGNMYAFVMHVNGKVIALNFGEDMQNSAPAISNNFSMISDVVGMELVNSLSDHYLFTVDFASNQIYRFDFPNPCAVNTAIAIEQQPVHIVYNSSGSKKIELKAFNSNNVKAFTKTIYVRPPVTAGFTVNNTCLGTTTNFNADVSPTGNRIVSYAWDFGDGNTASGKNAAFAFSSEGIFPVTLTITDACGKMSDITKQVTITKRNTADFNGPSISCSNESVLFEDASTSAGDVIKKWQWDFGDGQTSTQQNPEHLFTEAGNFTVSLSITGASGCTETVTKSIIIKAGAFVDFMVENACLGNTTSFLNLTTFSPGTSELSREWNFGDNTTSTDLHPTHNYAATGTYTVTLTVLNNLNCTITKTKVITIRKKPVTDFSYALACSGEAVNFLDGSISTDGSIKTWSWDFGDIESGTNNYSAAQQGSHIFAKAGTYKVKLKIETIYGCVDSLTKDITIIPSPQSAFAMQVNCTSKEVTFTDQSTFDSTHPITNWYWDFGDNTTSQEQHPIHTYSSAGDYTITLITTASSRCTNLFSKVIHINDQPIADFSFPDIICINNQIRFTDKSTSAMDAITGWQWDFGSYGNSSEQHPQVVFTSAQLAILPVMLTVTTSTGCSASVTKNISLSQPAQVSFSFESVAASAPLSLNFYSTASNATVLSWNFGDGNLSNQPHPQHTYESGGIYNVSLTAVNADGCSTIVQQEISVSSISANVELKLETVTIVKTGTATELQIRLVNSSPYILRELDLATLIDEKNTFIYLWQGELLPGKMLVYNYAIPENINSNLASACVTAVSQSLDKTSNRQCSSIESIFTILMPYPNPVASEMYIPFMLPAKGEVEISIIDILGRLQTRNIYTLEAGFHQIQINKGNLAAGVYLIQYDFAGQKQIKSIVVN
ncbi:PKD domain-containing protein [Rhodocytophaga rosea]|uniref:PKD domain-containing protein n=1 Tax=Rhodocytophaga rosea TaxID=2704465 RepID=A0A6C0GR20_9BACT|nr:PKD domain-containing protein [Rhodocytophaga rosea]QHT70535.1 PKD domain-containing protein [Rhodocytophaga rosea]